MQCIACPFKISHVGFNLSIFAAFVGSMSRTVVPSWCCCRCRTFSCRGFVCGCCLDFVSVVICPFLHRQECELTRYKQPQPHLFHCLSFKLRFNCTQSISLLLFLDCSRLFITINLDDFFLSGVTKRTASLSIASTVFEIASFSCVVNELIG